MRYLIQALAMMREEKLYSAMYICGTALAIAFTMLIAEVYYVKTANIAPEVNRSKTYYLETMGNRNWKENSNDSIPVYVEITQEMFRDVFLKMKTPECVKAEVSRWLPGDWYMKLADGIHDRSVVIKLTEPNYFRFSGSTSRREHPSHRTISTTSVVWSLSPRKSAKSSSAKERKVWARPSVWRTAITISVAWWKHPAC